MELFIRLSVGMKDRYLHLLSCLSIRWSRFYGKIQYYLKRGEVESLMLN